MAEDFLERDTVALMTPIQNGKVLAAFCGINGIRAKVVETSAGSFAVLDDTSARATDRAGKAVSASLRGQPVLAMERRSGHMKVYRWTAGKKTQELSPGLALNKAPGVIVTLMSGSQTIEEIAAVHPGKVHVTPAGRWKSSRALRALARQAKKQLRA